MTDGPVQCPGVISGDFSSKDRDTHDDWWCLKTNIFIFLLIMFKAIEFDDAITRIYLFILTSDVLE